MQYDTRWLWWLEWNLMSLWLFQPDKMCMHIYYDHLGSAVAVRLLFRRPSCIIPNRSSLAPNLTLVHVFKRNVNFEDWIFPATNRQHIHTNARAHTANIHTRAHTHQLVIQYIYVLHVHYQFGSISNTNPWKLHKLGEIGWCCSYL